MLFLVPTQRRFQKVHPITRIGGVESGPSGAFSEGSTVQTIPRPTANHTARTIPGWRTLQQIPKTVTSHPGTYTSTFKIYKPSIYARKDSLIYSTPAEGTVWLIQLSKMSRLCRVSVEYRQLCSIKYACKVRIPNLATVLKADILYLTQTVRIRILSKA